MQLINNLNIKTIQGTQIFSPENNEALIYFNKMEGIRRIPCFLSNSGEIIRLDTLKKRDLLEILLINGKYELPEEIPCALGDPYEISLTSEWAEKFADNEIDAGVLEPEHVVSLIEDEIKKSVLLADNQAYKTLSLWIYGTYFYNLFYEYPYLLVTGDNEVQVDKLTQLLNKLCFNTKFTAGFSPKGIVRTIHREGGTIIFKEPNQYMRSTKRLMESIIGAGYSFFSYYIDEVKIGDIRIPKRFTLYSPKIFVYASEYESLIHGHCLEINVSHLAPQQSYISEDNPEYLREISSKCGLSALLHFNRLNDELKAMGKSKLFSPLTALAKYIGNYHGSVK